MPTLPLKTLLAFAGIYLIWGTTFLGIAISIQTLPPFTSGTIRFLIASGLLYGWLRLGGKRPFAEVDFVRGAVTGILLLGLGNGLVIWAEQGVPSGIAALIVGAIPVTVLIFDWAFFARRAPSLQAATGIAIALLGVVIMVAHTRTLSGNVRPLHLVALLAAVSAWSLGTLIQKRTPTNNNVLSFACVQMFWGGASQAATALLNGEWQRFDPAHVSWQSALAVLYLVVFGSIVALVCYLWLLSHVAAQKVTTYALVNPVVALLLGALILNESISAITIASSVLVLAGVSLVLFQSRTLRQAEQAAEST